MNKIFILIAFLLVGSCTSKSTPPPKTAFAYNQNIRLLLAKIQHTEFSWGSAIVDKESRLLLTANHVVEDRQVVTIVFPSSKRCTAQKIFNAQRTTLFEMPLDVALLKLEEQCEFTDTPLWRFGQFENVGIDDAGVLHGYPFIPRITNGLPVTLENRTEIRSSGLFTCACFTIMSDTTVDPHGTSGGPIVVDGAVVAIMKSLRPDGPRHTYTIPIEDVLVALGL